MMFFLLIQAHDIVIGETAKIGQNCSFLHGVTLGGTGKEPGQRHPTIGDNVLIGCNATVLGNISIGNLVKIGSGSMILKSVPAGCTIVGNPGRIIGTSTAEISVESELSMT
jgi:serine O-acetyltransferase